LLVPDSICPPPETFSAAPTPPGEAAISTNTSSVIPITVGIISIKRRRR
jgi:hypothetical protein